MRGMRMTSAIVDIVLNLTQKCKLTLGIPLNLAIDFLKSEIKFNTSKITQCDD